MNRFSFVAFYSLLLTLACSCDKEEGCLVPYADNFNANAKVDDGSCSYTGKRVFWLSKYSSDSLEVLDDSTELKFFINDTFISSNVLKNYHYLLAEPADCDIEKALTIRVDLSQGNEEEFRNIKVYNVYNKLLFEDNIRFSASYCHTTEVTPFK